MVAFANCTGERVEQAADEYEQIDATVWLPPDEELLTDARRLRGDTFTIETDRGGTETRAYANDLLGYYVSRGLILPKQQRAGKKLHQLHQRSWSARYKLMRFGAQAGEVALEDVMMLGKLYRDAILSVRGNTERRITWLVACYGEKAGRGNMLYLKSGLDDLVRHFDY